MGQKLNNGHFHEAMHTAYVLLDTWDGHVLEAQATKKTKALKKQADKAHQAMYDFYQMAGAELHKREL